jgi:hypothetical protein
MLESTRHLTTFFWSIWIFAHNGKIWKTIELSIFFKFRTLTEKWIKCGPKSPPPKFQPPNRNRMACNLASEIENPPFFGKSWNFSILNLFLNISQFFNFISVSIYQFTFMSRLATPKLRYSIVQSPFWKFIYSPTASNSVPFIIQKQMSFPQMQGETNFHHL